MEDAVHGKFKILSRRKCFQPPFWRAMRLLKKPVPDTRLLVPSIMRRPVELGGLAQEKERR